jgi:hypothetical protein
MDCGIVRNKISQVKYNGNQIGTIDMASLMIILPKGTNKKKKTCNYASYDNPPKRNKQK